MRSNDVYALQISMTYAVAAASSASEQRYKLRNSNAHRRNGNYLNLPCTQLHSVCSEFVLLCEKVSSADL